MAKNSTIFVCSECGATSPRWLGRCPSCGKFNTLAEEVVTPEPQKTAAKKSVYSLPVAKPLKDIGYEIMTAFPRALTSSTTCSAAA